MYHFGHNSQTNTSTVIIENTTILLDTCLEETFSKLHGVKKIYWHLDEEGYLYRKIDNNYKIYLYEHLTDKSRFAYNFKFKNGNINDYRIENFIITDKWREELEHIIKTKYEIIKYFEGHVIKAGAYANEYRNPYWFVKELNSDNEEQYFIMHLKDDKFCKFSIESIDKVLYLPNLDYTPTWYLSPIGYAITSDGKGSKIYMHSVIMNYFGHGKGTKTIDHINRDKLDNRLDNLRIATQSEQNQNRAKRNRNQNAKPLPENLNDKILPRYVIYYKEKLIRKNGNESYREFFRIEKHPKLPKGKRIDSSKSMKIDINDKLDAMKQELIKLDGEITY